MSHSNGWSQPVDATLYLTGEMECAVMDQRFHRGFTAAEKTELWDRWKRGESLKAIGRAFGKQSSSIYFLVALHGGIRPADRRRSRLALTLAEREVISRGISAHQSARSIAKLLGRSPSTVSREMGRTRCTRYEMRVCIKLTIFSLPWPARSDRLSDGGGDATHLVSVRIS